jgi:hypothetical protein
MELREAAPEDAAALSRLHAVAWEATFVGQVPDALAEERIRKAQERDWVTPPNDASQLVEASWWLPRPSTWSVL